MIKITIEWYTLKKIAQASADNYKFLQENSKATMAPLEDILIDKGYCHFEGLITDLTECPDWMLADAKFEVLRPMKLLRDGGMRVTKENAAELFATAQVHLPGNELMRIRKVFVMEDACTDAIQEELEAGCSILAICPQPSRRPDYIMGKV